MKTRLLQTFTPGAFALAAASGPRNGHTPTLIKDGINAPYLNENVASHLNTYLIYAASMAVPAGFTGHIIAFRRKQLPTRQMK